MPVLRTQRFLSFFLFSVVLFAARAGAQVVSTIAGTGVAGFAGDNGPAATAQLTASRGMNFDAQGNLYLCQVHRIRKIDVNGIITTIAGNGTAGFSGDGGPATAALLSTPADIAVDAAGNIFFSDEGNTRIRRIDATTGIITTIAGGGSLFTDGIAATSAALGQPRGLAFDPAGHLFVADCAASKIRRIDMNTGIITTVAGGGNSVSEGVPAINSILSQPSDVTFGPNGVMYIADGTNFRLRRVDGTGLIHTVAGSAYINGYPPLYAWQATTAVVGEIVQVVADTTGVYFACGQDVQQANAIFRLDSASGVLYYYGGNSSASFSGDGGYVGFARFNSISGLALHPSGQLHIADGDNHRIRKVTNSCIYPVTPLLTVGNNAVCHLVTDTFAVAIDSSVTSYTWSLPYNWTGTSNTNMIIVGTDTLGGTVSVYGTNSCGNGLPMLLSVFTSAFYPTMNVSPSAEVCQGQPVQLSVNVGSAFQWYCNGAPIPGANSSTYAPAQAGVYSVYASNGACWVMSNDTAVAFHPVPFANVTDTTSLCFDSLLQLHALGDTGLTFQWYSNAQPVALTTDTFYHPVSPGNYSFVATNSFGCGVASDTVSVYPVPAPVISQAGNWLSVPAVYGSFQWYLNNVLIPGAVSNTYLVATDGIYHVVVTDNGCTGMSDTVGVHGLQVSLPESETGVWLYPNPVRDEATLVFANPGAKAYSFTLYNAGGAVVQEVTGIGSGRLNISRHGLPAGFYFYTLNVAGSAPCHGRMVVE